MSVLGITELSVNPNDSKHYNMKQFIDAVKSYLQTRTEDTANIINRHLQLLSVTIDLSTFDPNAIVVVEFFVSLYELLSSLETRSALAWCCVNVLALACRNPASRNSLIHTYQFLPLLSRLLGDGISLEKKIKLLSLMQELTCGIKISWQIPHLPHLMSTLTRWIESNEEEIVTLSLGVLVNLCYKNLSAIYTLSRCVDIKKFLRSCMPLKGIKIEVHVCKLLIILDYMNGKVPEGTFMKLIEVTFRSTVEAFRAGDPILLRHVVEFFLDMWKQNNHTESLVNFSNYDSEVDELLKEIEVNSVNGNGDILNHDPECMTLVMEFLHFLIQLQLPKLEIFNPRLVNISLQWVQVDSVCSNALAILRTVALNTKEHENTILEPFLNCLPIFLLTVENTNETDLTNIENSKRLSALMELLRALVKAETTRNRVLEVTKEDLILKIFMPLLGDTTPSVRASSANSYSTEAILLYVNAILLINEIVKHDLRWHALYENLMQQKQIHMVLSQALYCGPKETKSLIMGMASTRSFPVHQVASTMCELQPLIQGEVYYNGNCNQIMADNLCFPMMSVTQLERLDEVMNKLKEQNNYLNVATSDVMELYEYKLATMSHAERAATTNVEAASQRCTRLQHRTEQLTAELSRMHRLLLHAQQCQEVEVKAKNSILEKHEQLQQWFDAENSRFSSELAFKEKCLSERTTELEETRMHFQETQKQRNELEQVNLELKSILVKLEENLVQSERLVEKKDGQISRLTATNEHLKMENVRLEKQVNHVEAELSNKKRENKEVSKDLYNCKQIIGTITQLTNNSQYSK